MKKALLTLSLLLALSHIVFAQFSGPTGMPTQPFNPGNWQPGPAPSEGEKPRNEWDQRGRGERQPGNRMQDKDREAFQKYMETRRIAFFTEKMNLTPQEATRFWPEYNMYSFHRNRLEFEKQEILMRAEKSTDPNKDLFRYMQIVREDAGLQEKFQRTLSTFLPPKKILALYKAEVQFRHLILRDMRGDRGGED